MIGLQSYRRQSWRNAKAFVGRNNAALAPSEELSEERTLFRADLVVDLRYGDAGKAARDIQRGLLQTLLRGPYL